MKTCEKNEVHAFGKRATVRLPPEQKPRDNEADSPSLCSPLSKLLVRVI